MRERENTHTHTEATASLSFSPPPSSDGVVCFCFFSRQESLKIERHPLSKNKKRGKYPDKRKKKKRVKEIENRKT
jgi:hypothetical protein